MYTKLPRRTLSPALTPINATYIERYNSCRISDKLFRAQT